MPASTFCLALAALVILPAGQLAAQTSEVLYDQRAVPSTEHFPSQQFQGAQADFSSQGADDFVVPDGGMWSVTQVTALGVYRDGLGAAASVRLFVYADDGGRPGAELLRYTGLPVQNDAGGDLTVALAPSAVLAAGTYWLSFVVVMGGSGIRQWLWTKQATETPIGAEMHWRNPGDGFGLDCTDWQPLTTGCGDDGGLDTSFRLGGRVSDAFVSFTPAVVTDTLPALLGSGTQTVTLANDTDQPVSFSFPIFVGGIVADVSPSEGVIPAEGTADVALTFTSDGLGPGVYRDTLEVTTDLGPEGSTFELPVALTVEGGTGTEGEGAAPAFALRRNYPNPFASHTTVEMLLPEAGALTVEVYDTLGRRAAVLLDEVRPAGQHLLRWDAGAMASGVYVVRAWSGTASASLPVVLAR